MGQDIGPVKVYRNAIVCCVDRVMMHASNSLTNLNAYLACVFRKNYFIIFQKILF